MCREDLNSPLSRSRDSGAAFQCNFLLQIDCQVNGTRHRFACIYVPNWMTGSVTKSLAGLSQLSLCKTDVLSISPPSNYGRVRVKIRIERFEGADSSSSCAPTFALSQKTNCCMFSPDTNFLSTMQIKTIKFRVL